MKKKANPIQRKFFFGTIAETTRKKIIRYLKKNNYDFEETYDYKIIVRNITFEGFHCKEVTLSLFREVVYYINADLGVFEDENLFKSTHSSILPPSSPDTGKRLNKASAAFTATTENKA